MPKRIGVDPFPVERPTLPVVIDRVVQELGDAVVDPVPDPGGQGRRGEVGVRNTQDTGREEVTVPRVAAGQIGPHLLPVGKGLRGCCGDREPAVSSPDLVVVPDQQGYRRQRVPGIPRAGCRPPRDDDPCRAARCKGSGTSGPSAPGPPPVADRAPQQMHDRALQDRMHPGRVTVPDRSVRPAKRHRAGHQLLGGLVQQRPADAPPRPAPTGRARGQLLRSNP